jgi:hypothetical protein
MVGKVLVYWNPWTDEGLIMEIYVTWTTGHFGNVWRRSKEVQQCKCIRDLTTTKITCINKVAEKFSL